MKNQDAKSEIDEPKKIITELWSAWKNALAEIKEKHKQEKMTLMMANLTLYVTLSFVWNIMFHF